MEEVSGELSTVESRLREERDEAGQRESAPKEGREGVYMYDVHVYLKVCCEIRTC